MSWTHAICDDDWDKLNPARLSPRRAEGEQERCCWCGTCTVSGLYLRADPATTPFCLDTTRGGPMKVDDVAEPLLFNLRRLIAEYGWTGVRITLDKLREPALDTPEKEEA